MIDYRALAERLEAHAECHAHVEPYDDEQRQWAADLRTVVSLLSKYESLCIALAKERKAAPQPQPEPIDPHMIVAEDRFPDEPEPTEAQHPDDAAVDRFAAAMKAKLAEKRAEGRGGWDDPAQCSTGFLARLLREHVEKGDPLDVGNFAMMLWNRGGATNEMRAALAAKEKS